MVLTPAIPVATFRGKRTMDSPVRACLASVYAMPIGVTNLPNISIPYKFGTGNVPVNVRLVNGDFNRTRVLGTTCGCRRITTRGFGSAG